MLTPRIVLATALTFALPLSTTRAADLDPRIPDDSEWVLHVNVEQLDQAPAVKKHAGNRLRLGFISHRADALNALPALGINPDKDVQTITAAGTGTLDHEPGLLIVRGNFDAAKLRAAADALVKQGPAAWKAVKQGDVMLYEVRDSARPQPTYLTILADGTVLAALTKKYLAEAAALDPKRPVKVSKELRELVKKADAKDDAWLAAIKSPRIQELLAKGAQTATIADDVTAFTGRLKVGDDVQIGFSVHTKDKKTAEEVAHLLDAAKGFIVLSLQGQEPLLVELIDACTTATDGGMATLSGRLSEEQIAKALKKK